MAALAEQDWLMAALRAVARGGVQAVRVEVLAKELGVTKGSFYHHFSKRQALLDRMIAYWQRIATQEVIEQTNAGTDDAHERLLNLALFVFAEHPDADNIEGAVREWAASAEGVAKVVAEVDRQRIGYVTELLQAAGVPTEQATHRAHLMYRALIGEYTWRRHGGASLSEEALRDMVALLVQTS